MSGASGEPDYLKLPLEDLLEMVASREPAPGGGSVAAVSVALAAGLAAMAARFSVDHLPDASELAGRSDSLREKAATLANADAAAYGRVLAAQRARSDSIGDALSEAADVPLEVAEVGMEVAEIAEHLAGRGSPNLRGDALCAAELARAATRAAAQLAEINLRAAGIEDGRLSRARELAGEE